MGALVPTSSRSSMILSENQFPLFRIML
jgi:hypothetical protein